MPNITPKMVLTVFIQIPHTWLSDEFHRKKRH